MGTEFLLGVDGNVLELHSGMAGQHNEYTKNQ